uniref:Peptidase S8/S53 domain-containing protein n=1 Tax=Nelumbo nucifera TaxID=4432 RepID=A0A822YQY7_NELNU|nr:TPA_asm: hypothetical protein HUJ06_012641 [Nelumbo nucifera]
MFTTQVAGAIFLYTGSTKLFSNFNIMYGTSMACPHVVGMAALLKAVHPERSPTAIQSVMMIIEDSLNTTLKPITELLDGEQPTRPLAMGAGHLNPNKALNFGLVYDANIVD